MSKLEIRNISKVFSLNNDKGKRNNVLAVKNVNLSIEEGQFVCFVGPSGCGKSTLLNIIAGLEKPSSGEMILNGRPVFETGPDRIMVFQENALFPWLSVIDNVEFGLKMVGVEKEKEKKLRCIILV